MIIKRRGALGDVLMTTPVARALKERGFPVGIDTGCEQAYAGNQDASIGAAGAGDQVVDLDLAYERRPDLHAVEAYFLEAGLDGDRTIRFAPREDSGYRGPYVAIHAARSWASRTLPEAFWRDLAALVLRSGRDVVWLGQGRDYAIPANENFWGQSLARVAGVIGKASAFVCSDSALLHLAGATETPIVGLFTSVSAARRMPWRHGSMSWRAVGIDAGVECAGCIETTPAPATCLTCRRGDNQCVNSFDASEVMRAVRGVWR
jgi:ADP-heptose:LPS heptosyltransferase